MIQSDNISTGFSILDSVLEGGLYKGNLVLLCGNPGSGKTVFSATFLFSGLRNGGDRCIYVNFNETREEFLYIMKRLGMDFSKYERSGLFKYINALSFTDIRDLKAFSNLLMKEIIDFKPKRLVIDSITTIFDLMDREMVRAFITNFLKKIAANQEVTMLLVYDIPFNESKIGKGIEEFLADIVLYLKRIWYNDKYNYYLEVRKARGKMISTHKLYYHFTSKGIVFSRPLTKEIKGKISELKKITTGISKLDLILNGGFIEGSLIGLVGTIGVGKTVFALNFAIKNAAIGFKVLYISFRESREALIHKAKSLIDVNLPKSIKIITINPTTMPLSEIQCILDKHYMETKPDILIIDGLETYKIAYGNEEFLKYVYRRVNSLKNNLRSILVLLTTVDEGDRMGIEQLGDYLIEFRMREKESMLIREIKIIKSLDIKKEANQIYSISVGNGGLELKN